MLVFHLNILAIDELQAELKSLNCDPAGLAIMQNKLSAHTIKITDLKGYCALALKETALSAGGECALPRKTIRATEELADCLLLCTPAQLITIAEKCQRQAFQELRALGKQLLTAQNTKATGLPKLMGILNVTPDSFSDGGKFLAIDKAVEHALEMCAAGASLIDIGGESTRPGSSEISETEELNRVIPVISALHKKDPQLLISIDTTKSNVARAAIAAGATMINDISGLTRDPELARVAAETGAQLVLMHRLAASETMQNSPQYTDLLKEILTALVNSVALAKTAGVAENKIILDPGIGFGKTKEHNLYLLKQLCAFRSLGYPLLLGTSRKAVIGLTLNKLPSERLLGTAITSALAEPYVEYLRVHDISENKDAILMAQAIRGAKL